jgi:hypothetical protein
VKKINSKNKDGETPLHIMAQHRSSYDCLELLIVEGANVDAQDNDGLTPLMNAVHHPQAMMRKDVIYGLAHNSDTSIKNKEGKTAYDIAKENNVTGSRIMGGGFGGCTINLVRNDLYAKFIADAKQKFNTKYGHEPKVYDVVIGDGARKIC